MRILVVDDDKELSSFLQKALKAECYEVDLASDGEKGSFLARTNDYDLVILDNIMPKKNGGQVCREIRQDGSVVPILVLSVQDEAITKADHLDAGADDYLAKPFSLQELLARVRALLRRSHQLQDEILKIADLVLDTKKHTVSRDNSDIYLTTKEMELLEYLMRNPGVVITRAMILEHIWDMSADLLSNSIEVHISNLRKKINLPDHKELIHTLPGRGYKIADL